MFIFTPILAVVGLFFVAGAYHLALLVVGGPSRGLHATLGVPSYSMAAQVFNYLPVFGGMLVLVALPALHVVGLREVHGLDTAKAIVIVVVPLMTCAVLFFTAWGAAWMVTSHAARMIST